MLSLPHFNFENDYELNKIYCKCMELRTRTVLLQIQSLSTIQSGPGCVHSTKTLSQVIFFFFCALSKNVSSKNVNSADRKLLKHSCTWKWFSCYFQRNFGLLTGELQEVLSSDFLIFHAFMEETYEELNLWKWYETTKKWVNHILEDNQWAFTIC